MAERNPGTTQRSSRRHGAHYREPVEPSKPVRKNRSFASLFRLIVLVALVAAGFFAWQRFGDRLPALSEIPGISSILSRFGKGEPTVEITVNGESVDVPENSSVQAVFDQVKPSVAAGNLLSVSGAVLTEGGGDAYGATLNGQPVAVADASATMVEQGAALTFSDGADATEDYTSEVVATSSPKLVRQVKEGTSDQGYMVQQGVVQYVYQWGRQGSKEVRTGSVSGEKVDGEVVEGQDCIIMCQDIHPDNDEKLVALTFDDGPSAYTQSYLDILNSHGAKATFMLIGEQVEGYPEVMQANIAAQNQLCSHTWHHPDLTTLNEEETHQQLGDTFDVIKRVGSYDTTSIRAPYGDIDFDVWLRSGGMMSLSVFWTHDSEDWKLPGVDAIVSNCTSNMAPGSVILMHDGGGNRDQDIEALPRIIEAWQEAGYRFVTIEELMASDSSIPEECRANNRPMPEDAVWPTEKAEG